jgi:hypothetical protein
MTSQPQELSEAEKAEKAEKAEVARYDVILAEMRPLCLRHGVEDVTLVANLMEIEDLAQKELVLLEKTIEEDVNSWNIPYNHREILRKSPWKPAPDSPDAFFSRRGDTKSRLILRLTSKVILTKVRAIMFVRPNLLLNLISHFKTYVLHKQIVACIERWDKNIRFEVEEPPQAQKRGRG